MAKRKFFKTVLKVEILSENKPIDDTLSLSEIAYEITEGGCSGKVETEMAVKLSGKEMAQALQAQASDPEFFQLDEEGNDLE